MKRLFFTSLILFLLFSFNSNATKWRVNNTVGIDADFTSFKEAHDAATPGDTLMFEGSNLAYGDKDTLYKKLVIIGPGYFLGENEIGNDNILPAELGVLYVDSAGRGSVIIGMSIVGGFDALQVDASDLIIERNHINGTIAFCYEKAVQNCIVSKNYLASIDTRWSSETLFATGLIITNNIATGSIGFNAKTTATITNNLAGNDILAVNSVIKNNISGYLNVRDGSTYQFNVVSHDAPAGTGNVGNVVWDDLFVTGDTSTDGRYVLSENSVAKEAGEGSVDCGPFGGDDQYILSGLPPMPFIYNVEIPSTATGSMVVKINARSQK
ncbi:hypothetical protein ACE1ET_19085 [Saccharicrinis sp. FJH62]|uniref:hypothetical protein n=1 Tax=Saccharicrinis sp. FJH62 TaxID=3344657 RepID=UPI0035D50CBE